MQVENIIFTTYTFYFGKQNLSQQKCYIIMLY